MHLILASMIAWAAFGQAPRFVNAQMETRGVRQKLEAEIRLLASRGQEASWIAYTVPRVKRSGASCCYWDDYRGCSLEESKPFLTQGLERRPVLLEGPIETVILLRVEKGDVMKLRSFSADCDLDAGGLHVTLLTAVPVADSVAMLRGYLSRTELRTSAVRTIATHADDSADVVLEELSQNAPEDVRRQALSSMGSLRGSRGFDGLMRLVNSSNVEERWRERAVSSLAANSDERVPATLSSLARTDHSAAVRTSALNALPRRGGAAALNVLREAVEQDPDRGVRKKAVAAFSRVPENGGVPLLIGLARNQKLDAELRKEAVRSLSRIKDERASAYIDSLFK